ncbi:MAG TPA: phytanoyl-CoA dioxygenase family protein, partial [Gemmataceae bacterium]|nr:phytanoyl-CoA dioxygenase family protein [Gemmataceae bacterium]
VYYHMQPGDVLVFEKTVVHASKPNTSDHMRLSLDYRFFGSAASTTKHYLDLDTREVVSPVGRAA